MNSFNDNDRGKNSEDYESLESILNRYMFGDDYESTTTSRSSTATAQSSSSSRFEKDPYKSTQSKDDSESVSKRIGLATLEKKQNTRDDLKNSHSKDKHIPKPGLVMLFFGVFLPVCAMLFEYKTHIMARNFLDPFPTINHYLLFSVIPISCFLTWLAARTNIISVYAITALGAGMALGVSILYSLMLLPMTPLLFLMFPLGLLGLAPLFSIFQTLRAGNTICAIASRHDTFFDPHQFKHLGHLIILVMVVAVELPSTLTRIHLTDAASYDQVKAQQSLDWLRAWGSRDVLLRACYERSGRATDLVGSLYEHQHPVSVNKARNVYYKVTGVPFNAVAIPASFRGTIQHNGLISDPARLNAGAVDEFDLDPDIAGEMVQGVARGLSVTESKIEGKVDANAAVAALDWTFNFANISKVPREARAKILLPPNAVVTRATMWIDGIEKEAKVMGRSRARATYQRAVVTHKRDPLLVSMQGKDTVLVQCYPVLKGSDTKVRLHIASPLKVKGKEAILNLPMFAERNFTFPQAHTIVLESKTGFKTNNGIFKTAKAGNNFKLNSKLDNKLLARAKADIAIERDANIKFARLAKPLFNLMNAPVNNVVPFEKPKKLTVVVDKSKSMAPYMAKIKEGLKNIPKGIDVYLIEVGDSGYSMITKNIGEPSQQRKLYLDPKVSTIKFSDAINLLDRTKCDGGRVNSNTIARLLLNNSSTAGTAYGDILWIHGAQPVAGSRDKQYVERISKFMPTKLYDLQIASGPNALFDKSSMVKNFIRVPRSGDLKADLNNLFASWKKAPEANFVEICDENTVKTIPEFEKLVAYKEVLEKYYLGDQYGASALAVSHHIITPVTSAVVTDDKIIRKYEMKNRVRSMAPSDREFPAREIAKNIPLMILSPYGCSRSQQKDARLERAKQDNRGSGNKFFEGLTNQLNSLSAAAGSAGDRASSRADLECKMAPSSGASREYYKAAEKKKSKSLVLKNSPYDMNESHYAPKRARARKSGFLNALPGASPEEERSAADSPLPSTKGGQFEDEAVMGKSLRFKSMKKENVAFGNSSYRQAGQKQMVGKDQLMVAQELAEDDIDGVAASDKFASTPAAIDFDGGELELVTEGEATKAATVAQVVPEPETIFMLLLAVMVLVGGLFVIQKQKSLNELK